MSQFTTEDWENTDIEIFDEAKHYMEVIKPKLDEVVAMCQERGIPLVFHAVVAIEKDGVTHATTRMLNPISRLSIPLFVAFMANDPEQLFHNLGAVVRAHGKRLSRL